MRRTSHNMRLKTFKASLHMPTKYTLYLTTNIRVRKVFDNRNTPCPFSIDYFQKVNSNCFVPDFESTPILESELGNAQLYPLCVEN